MPLFLDPEKDHNIQTSLPASIKGKITAYRNAVENYAFIGSQPLEHHSEISQTLQIARYNLEQTILTHIKKANKP